MEKPKTRVKYCNTIEQVKELISYCKTTKICSFDFETNAQPYYSTMGYPTILGVSFQPGSAYIIPLGHFDSPFKDNWVEILQLFGREVMMDSSIIKIAHNLKFEWKWMKRYGIDIIGRLFDTMLAKYLLDENTKSGLKETVAMVFPKYAGYDNEIDFLIKKHKGWGNIPLEPLSEYCALDCDLTLRLMHYFHPKLIKNDFYKLYRNLLMMATRVLAESEYHGLHVDDEYLDTIIDKYQGKIDDELEKLRRYPRLRKYSIKSRRIKIKQRINAIRDEILAIRKKNKPNGPNLIKNREIKIKNLLEGKFENKKDRELDKPFNFSSVPQMVDLFYKSKYGFQWPAQMKKNKKTKKDGYTTDEAALLKLKGMKVKGAGFIDNLLEFRGLQTLHSTFMVGMKEMLDERNLLHAEFHLLTVTGRLGCREPNLQNIPRTATNPDVKPMFKPLPGMLHYEVDYSQAELRVVAELAQDKVMIDIFKRNYNIHMATACLLHGDINAYDYAKGCEKDENHPEHMYWVKLKKKAKSLNFGILYGRGARAVAEELEITEREAQDFIDKWLNAYPDVKRWIRNQQRMVANDGYVMSIFGRKRRLPDIWHDTKWIREKAERDAVNAPIQGSASDYTQLSTIELRRMRLMGELPAYFIQRYTVHDSIGFYLYAEDVHKIAKIVTKVCENPNTLEYFNFEMKHVRMKVANEVGINWGKLKDYDAWENYKKLVA